MNKYLSSSWNSVVSLDLENSWAARSLQDALKQARYDARFQQKQMQEKEEKLVKLYENQQQRAFERVGRSSAGSNGSITTTISTGKVRQMFDERRQKAGIDRSYPLEPLKNNSRPPPTNNRTTSLDRKNGRNPPATRTTTVKTNVQKSLSMTRNGKPLMNKREVARSVYNNNGDEEIYEESRYADDEAENYLKQHGDIVAMMNNHNLIDNLDDEEMPHIGFDDDDGIFRGKLANVGGKLPSQNVPVKKTPPTRSVAANGTAKNVTSPVKRETKPVLKNVTAKAKRTPSAGSSTPGSAPSSPVKMAAAKQAGDRVPSTNRPSARPSPKPPTSAVQRDDLSCCRFCQRRFATDRLQVHEEICSKTAKKRRKTYDATKHRLAGTEIEPYSRKPSKTGSSKVKPTANKSNWRQKHEEFISAIRAAKVAQAHVAKGGNIKDLPPPPPSTNPDYVQCPHCGRRFNETAAERHIPKCSTYQYNKPNKGPPRGSR